MELQFQKQPISCLQTILREVQTQEQTQEVRISDGMPDIGAVVGTWGQVIVRGKQWLDGEVSVNGGVMVWVLYRAEEGEQLCQLESWIPFQMRWDLPQTDHDGILHLGCLLRSVDARSTSARKLMLRVNVSAWAHAMASQTCDTWVPENLPEDVQLKKSTYAVTLPKEAGEKTFTLEETQTMPMSTAKAEKLIAYSLQPEILDKKVMTDKAVFRGMGMVHLVYQADDGGYYSCDLELPFSQYAQLDGEYEEDAVCRITPCVTTLEAELVEDQIKLKVGLSCQYTVWDQQLLELTEDAYSPLRDLEVRQQALQLPSVLDMHRQTLPLAAELNIQGQRMVDALFLPDQPTLEQDGDLAKITLPGLFQLCYYDMDGALQSLSKRVQETVELPAAQDVQLHIQSAPTGKPQAALGAQIRGEVLLQVSAFSGQGLSMVTGLEVGEEKQPDPNRPSLILRRAGQESLWETAKASGSTVEAIQKANALEGEPREGQILLIPVS